MPAVLYARRRLQMEGWWGWRFGTAVGPVSDMFLRSWPRVKNVQGIICAETKGTLERYSWIYNISFYLCACRMCRSAAASEIIGLAQPYSTQPAHGSGSSAFGASSPGAFPSRVHHQRKRSAPSPPAHAHSRDARCGVAAGHIAVHTHIPPPHLHMARLLRPRRGLCGADSAQAVAGD